MRFFAVLALLLALAPQLHASRGNHSMNIRGEEPITSCDALEVTFHDYEETVTAEETLQIAGTRLAVDTRNDGVQVIGWDGAGFSVTLCKALGLTNAGRTATLLESIRIVRNGDRISVAGPKNGDWVGYLIVRAPREATMDLAARNGPIDLANVSGRFTAKATNGPIGIRDASGEFRIETENGPISVARSRGDFTLDAQNGPINVKLGDAWEGKGLVARAVNGPLTVRVSPSFRSGLVVETDRHTPFDCDGPICRGARVDLDHARRFELGGAATPVVQLSTKNGPVSIKAR